MTRWVVIFGFILSFLAGLMLGIQKQPTVPAQAPATERPTNGRGSWLVSELQLTPEQQKQLSEIWNDTARRGGRQNEDQRRQLRRERDDAIAALIRPEDRARYDEVMKSYNDKQAASEAQWRQSFQQSVEKTKAILTPQQREKYEAMMARWDRDRNRPTTGPSTKPETSNGN